MDIPKKYEFLYPLHYLVDSLRRHVVGRADEGMGGGGFGREEATETQIAKLDDPLSRDEHVGRLDVSMHDASVR